MFDLFFRAAAILGLIAGLIYWLAYSWHDTKDGARSLFKTLTLAPLALFWLVTSGMAGSSDWTMALGLSLGVLGDYLLSRPGPRAFLAGMAAFGAGHLAYAAALFLRAGAPDPGALSSAQAIALAFLFGLVASTELWLAPRTDRLRQPVRAYVFLIALMAVAVILLPDGPGQAELRAGAILFLGSDLLLALQIFVLRGQRRRGMAGFLVWPAYVCGQLLIFWGSLLFWTFPSV
jgi:uncharacterized membrane protein YhhN